MRTMIFGIKMRSFVYLIFCVMTFGLSSCNDCDDCGPVKEWTEEYRVVNSTGHAVTIADGNNGEVTQCWVGAFDSVSFFCKRTEMGERVGTDIGKFSNVVFDEKATNNFSERNRFCFREKGFYTIATKSDDRICYRYVIGEDDYLYALSEKSKVHEYHIVNQCGKNVLMVDENILIKDSDSLVIKKEFDGEKVRNPFEAKEKRVKFTGIPESLLYPLSIYNFTYRSNYIALSVDDELALFRYVITANDTLNALNCVE